MTRPVQPPLSVTQSKKTKAFPRRRWGYLWSRLVSGDIFDISECLKARSSSLRMADCTKSATVKDARVHFVR